MTSRNPLSWPAPTSPDAPLSGMRVLDLGQQLPGPYATLLLASLGATVIKIEPPEGDAARHLDPEMFAQVNAGKTALALNLKDPRHRDRLYNLVRHCDVFVEGFRPGVVERLGCDFARLRILKENLIYCSVSGFGQSGPLANRPTHDISLQAIAGALAPGVILDRIGVPWVDLATATTAAFTIASAYHSGRGGYIDASMLDAAVSWAGVKPSAVSRNEPTYGTIATPDGGTMVIAILENDMWRRLCTALGWYDWVDDPDLARYADRQNKARYIRSRLDDTVAALGAVEVARLAVEYDLPLDRVGSLSAAEEQQLSTRQAAEGQARHPAVPIPVPWQTVLNPAPELPVPYEGRSLSEELFNRSS